MTYLLNILDLAFTLHALKHGAVELNPIVRWLPGMVFCKVFVVGGLCWWLGTRNEPIARNGMKLTAWVFGIVNLWHIVNIATALS